MKQTAVEWLVKEIEEKHNFRFGNYYWAEINQAKEMEKTQKIEFAKLHVEAALKEAGYAADTKEMSSHSINEMYRERIKQSYPLENIK